MMRALEVFVNGRRLCIAGVGAQGVVTASVLWSAHAGIENAFMDVNGLDGATNEVLKWSVPPIGVGSEITIRIVETPSTDPPSDRTPAIQDDED